ncbi:MAG TPA: sugar kinase [Clostridia bacterium]|nr:sugar kinase [Clostridia bacterium]
MKVVTFGEIMLRLAPEGYLRFLQEPKFQATFGGGEANVAVSLQQFGIDTSFVSKLPDNDIGYACIKTLNSFGVDTKNIAIGGERIGIYFLEKGASVRPSKVVYDRANSAISGAKESDFDWDKIFTGVTHYHFTGITPALSDSMAAITLQSLIAAKKHGVTVSCDLNYRKKLWSRRKANEVMSSLVKYVDILIANEEDAEMVFDIKPSGNNVEGGKLNKQGYEEVAKKLIEKYNFSTVACTLRESISANDNNWGAMLYTKGKAYYSKTYPLHIVDRVGGGDSFCGGLIYGIVNGKEPQDAVEFAVASSALKHTIEGDFNRVTVEEVEKLISGGASGRVQR